MAAVCVQFHSLQIDARTLAAALISNRCLLLLAHSQWAAKRSHTLHNMSAQVMADEGVVAPLNQYVQVYLNGKFYGLYGMIEEVGGVHCAA
jgi:hypothetical protein